tara:strand:- start:9 stop:401 length:393 start_codon:yes stop_codon:yes gene_type:complete
LFVHALRGVGRGRLKRKPQSKTQKIAKKTFNSIIDIKYIDKAKVGIITNTAFLFAVLEMLPLARQSLMSLPNILWFRSHSSILFDDFEKNQAAANTQGVVGTPGKTVPAIPTPKNSNPITKYTACLNVIN